MPVYPGLGLPLGEHTSGIGGYLNGLPSSGRVESKLLPVRELAMMMIMDVISDKENWHKKVFDDQIVSNWRDEALAIPDEQFCKLARSNKDPQRMNDETFDGNTNELEGILDEHTFNSCVEELRSKAKYYETSGIIPTLDACASIAKSDKLVTSEIHDAICEAFKILLKDQASKPDWHPGSNDMVQNLVHPSMYPLVFGRSKVFQDEVVGVNDAVEKWAGKGETIPEQDADNYYCSSIHQWLPANVAFQEDGKVKFTSYINNLHPNRYPQVYAAIERLIEVAIPIWDQCLTSRGSNYNFAGAGRMKSRFPHPENPCDSNNENWNPSDPQAFAHVEVDWKNLEKGGWYYQNPEYDDENEEKWKLFRKPKNPQVSFKEVEYAPALEERLAESFKRFGLQVIVKMASIELTPDKPEFPAGSWHVEGQINENICATALYYLDSENVLPSRLSFRMPTSEEASEHFDVEQYSYSWMEQVYGTTLSPRDAPCLQNYGGVETRQGRLLAFPNVFQHKLSSFRLKDPTKPGHRRFIALWLVDPTKRIISTANVPPQQMDWWLDAAFGGSKEAREANLSKLPVELLTLMQANGLNTDGSSAAPAQLPAELMLMVSDFFHEDENPLLMTEKEANTHRDKLMVERSSLDKAAEVEWYEVCYNFCEH